MLAHGTILVFLGPPGSGKGTQASRLSAALGIPAISTGEMLRRECQSGSKLGRAVQTVLNSGQLVSDDLINQVVASRIAQCDCASGCILDGYPRTVSQARYLSELLAKLSMPQPIVFDFDADCDEIISRLARRRECPHCRRIYSAADGSTDAKMVCGYDGTVLMQRADDNPGSIRERLRLYHHNASELVRYYRDKTYHRICATRPAAEIADEIISILEYHLPPPGLSNSSRLATRA